jgi:hypothetical protein
VVIWAPKSWDSAGRLITLNGQITAVDYVDILGSQVHPAVQILFPNNDAVFQHDNLPIHTARIVQSWFEEHEDALQQLPWPAQPPDLNITELLWSVLESRVRGRLPPPSPLKQPDDVLHEERYNIVLHTVQNLDGSTARRIQAVLQTNGGPTPY